MWVCESLCKNELFVHNLANVIRYKQAFLQPQPCKSSQFNSCFSLWTNMCIIDNARKSCPFCLSLRLSYSIPGH